MDWQKAALNWRRRAKRWKRDNGLKDADIAAAVEDLRTERGDQRELGRAAINHWITGTREPNLRDFLDWCIAAKADPRTILFGEKVSGAATNERNDELGTAPAVRKRKKVA